MGGDNSWEPVIHPEYQLLPQVFEYAIDIVLLGKLRRTTHFLCVDKGFTNSSFLCVFDAVPDEGDIPGVAAGGLTRLMNSLDIPAIDLRDVAVRVGEVTG